MMRKVSIFLVIASAILSSWIYWGSDLKLVQEITSREWQSKMITVIRDNSEHNPIGSLNRVDVTSNVKYLPNGTYIRVSTLTLYANGDSDQNIMNISETGKWEVSDNYLLISPKEFKNVSQSQIKDFTKGELELVTQLFKMDAQQSRRVDIVNDKTLLLTSLSHGSTVLFSN